MSEKIDIVLVKPNNQKRIFQDLSRDFSGIEPPLWLIQIAAYLREQKIGVAVIDAEAENLSVEETVQRALTLKSSLISVVVSGTNPSASTPNMPGARDFLLELKRQGFKGKTAISGLHPSALPARTLAEEPVDFVIVGEALTTHAQLIQVIKTSAASREYSKILGLGFRDGQKIVVNERAANIDDLGMLPLPAWDLLPMDKYRAHNWHCFKNLKERQPYAVVYTSLGCPFACDFCCINALFGKSGIRYRPASKVLDEIDFLVKHYHVRNIKILDEIFILNWPHVEAICDGIIARGYDLNIWVYGRIDTVKDFMLAKMKGAGINWIAYGIESASESVRAGVSKGKFDEAQIKAVIEMTHGAGIEVVANFIFGLPDDDESSMRTTLALAKELNCAYTNFYCAMAYPGSALYDEAVRQKVTLPQSWVGYSQFAEESLPLATKYLSAAEVLRFRDQAFLNYYKDERYLVKMGKRFGTEAVEHIQQMCAVPLKRKNY